MNQQPQPGLLRPREAEGRGKEREGGCPPPATDPRSRGRRAGPGGAVELTAAGRSAAEWGPGRGGERGSGEGFRLRTQQQPVHVKDQVSDRAQRGRRGGSGHGEAEQPECSRSRGRWSPRGATLARPET